MSVPQRQVRALFTTSTVTVYQAYAPGIALPAVAAGRFVPPFKRDRMTWIKPSFRWMMYRCGWGTKPGQEHVLAVEMTRDGFEWALENACLSHYVRDLYPDQRAWQERLRVSPVRVQWDPERSIRLAPLPHRSLQMGLSGVAAQRYVDEWIVGITDVTGLAHRVHDLVRQGRDDEATAALPPESAYPLPPAARDAVGASEWDAVGATE
ncbi:DUF4291 domain-containing protein [Virgisporangium ochraceum]|uniref:DUF4291 domain-containing protein n=1 Tax=Virgisporangium ochraceum TaxID=65505 RepID=A0A8J4ECU4_9ACTN|nr:DUF4291 domain-containing protein [Virgisporangium ochraceum]GIJ67257.1 hypothetical protein Voc01_021740 [Virgisporangium ochraceum]